MKSNKEDVLLFLVFFLFFVFLWDLFYSNPPSMQDSGELREHRDGWTDVEGGQFVKHKNNFLKFRNHRRRAVERQRCWLFGEEITFPHTASDLSLCIFLFSHRTSITTLGFSVWPVPVTHPGISLPAGHWTGGKRGRFLFFPLLRPPSAAADSITLCWRARVACRWYDGGADEAWG